MPKSAAPRRYIAFLRAINVGGHTVKMDRLRALFEALGFGGVTTFIASGNVVFETAEADEGALEKKIERHLRESLGYDVATFLRTVDEVAAAAVYAPFPDADLDGATLYVLFLKSEPGAEARKKVEALATDADSFHLHGRELYWLARKKMGESAISGAVLEKALGMPGTMRNANTVRRMAERLGGAA
ncbi:MAG TPA: DUF1697 domain-containing protein [Longimicrobium sp.]|nr:DUF1697 domain-containing protein [Longimicrobium sp.]